MSLFLVHERTRRLLNCLEQVGPALEKKTINNLPLVIAWDCKEAVSENKRCFYEESAGEETDRSSAATNAAIHGSNPIPTLQK